ncbi:MAG: sugar phosphate isomerase/epimerase family protein [Oscillospiraceae bacterium]|nr:sugar phosphate isomerase/epimerase family protein [Oscillospiraceae bacterium]
MKTAASISIQYNNPFSPFPAKDWRKGFKWAKDAGLDGVELIFSDPKLIDLGAVTYELDKLGLGVATLATGQATALEGFSLTSYSEEQRSLAVKRCCEDIDFSVELGTKPNVTIGLIRGRGSAVALADERELFKHELAKVAEYADKRGVKLNLEPINRYEAALLNSVEDTAAFLDEMGNPQNIGILYDTFHVNIEDCGQKHTIESFGRKIVHVHFADSNRRLPGEGHIDYREVVSALEGIGYNNWISLEMLSVPSSEYVQEHMKQRMDDIFK